MKVNTFEGYRRSLTLFAIFLLAMMTLVPVCSATTTELTITRLASDDTTILAQKTVDWQWMRNNLPVLGDGETVYYNQGPIFEGAWDEVHPDETYDPWNPTEDVNLEFKDHGEFMGTDVKDLCDLVGGASDGDTITIKASDGMSKTWPAEYIYHPDSRQGPMVIAWYHGKDGGYVDDEFTTGMRLYFLTETTNEQGMHVWGNWDMHESWDEDYWYYYNGQYPSASGNSVQMVNSITIHSQVSPSQSGSGGSDGSDVSTSTGFKGSALTVAAQGTVNGTVRIIGADGGFCTLENGDSCNLFLNTTGTDGISDARLYLFGTNDTAGRSENGENLEVSLDGQNLVADTYYADDADGSSNAVETWCYVLKTLPPANYTVHVRNAGQKEGSITLRSGVLVAPVSDTSGNRTSWWIAEGADAIRADPAWGITEDDACTTADFPDQIGRDDLTVGTLSVVSTGAAGNDTFTNRVTLNDGEWTDLLSGGEDAVSIGRADVTPYLRDAGNTVEIVSVPTGDPGDYMENRLVLLVATRMPVQTSAPAEAASTATAVTPSERETSPVAGVNVTAETTLQPESTEASGNWFSNLWAMIAGWFGIEEEQEEAPAPVVTPVATQAIPTPETTLAAENSSVTVITYPAGAQVFLDGAYTGQITPTTLPDLKTGRHTVRVELEDYSPYETTFDLEEDTDISASLDPLNPSIHVDPLCLTLAVMQGTDSYSGGIYVEASDDGADIYIDNTKIEAKTPQVINGLKAGLHRVKVKKDKATSAVDTKTVWVTAGVVVPVYFDRNDHALQKTLTLDIPEYRGELCSVNGYSIGKKVPVKVTVDGLNSFVSVAANGSYISVPISNFAADGSSLTLVPETDGLTSLAVTSKPAGAEIFVDGFDTGYATPCTVENVSPGRHRIMLTKPDYLPEDQVILVPKGDGEQTIKLTLEPYANGALYVNSTPIGAKIYLFGQNTGEVTPHLFTGMDIGEYSVKVVGRSDAKTVDEVLVRPNEVTTCDVRLRR